MKLEHIGIAVKDLEASNELFALILGNPPYKIEEVNSEKVRTSFFRTGQSKLELLEAMNPESPIAKFIDQRGEGIHHLAFEVANIHQEMERLHDLGFTLLNETPKRGADNKWVCFLHPRGTNRVLIELCQEIQSESDNP